MTLLLVSSDHQQPMFLMGKINGLLFSIRKDFNHLCIWVFRYDRTCKYVFIIFPKINSPWQGFTHICVGELGSHLLKWWLVVDYSTVPLHSLNGRQFPAIKTVQGDCQWPLKTVENSHQSHELIIHCDWDNPNLWFHQPITKEWCRSTWVYVSYPIDNPTATRLGLCSSLWHASSYVPSCHLINNILLVSLTPGNKL